MPGGWRWGNVVGRLVGGGWEYEFVAGFGDASEVIHDEPAEGFVGAFGGEVSEVFFQFIETDETGDGPGAGGVLVKFLLFFFVVVFIVDVAEDFFDDILNSDEAGGAAVFVLDQDDLGASGADSIEDSVTIEGFGDGADGVGDAAQGGGGALMGGDSEGVFVMDDTDGVVKVAVDDREAGIAGGGSFGEEVKDGVVVGEGFDSGAGGHELLGGGGAKKEGAAEEIGDGFVEAVVADRIAD